MELELRIRGDSAEIEQAIGLLRGIRQSSFSSRHESLDDLARVFARDDLSEEGKTVLKLIIEKSLNGSGATESELKEVLGGSSIDNSFVYGVMGGLGRRWSSIAGPEHDTPFRKNRSLGTYLLPVDLATSLAKAFGE